MLLGILLNFRSYSRYLSFTRLWRKMKQVTIYHRIIYQFFFIILHPRSWERPFNTRRLQKMGTTCVFVKRASQPCTCFAEISTTKWRYPIEKKNNKCVWEVALKAERDFNDLAIDQRAINGVELLWSPLYLRLRGLSYLRISLWQSWFKWV